MVIAIIKKVKNAKVAATMYHSKYVVQNEIYSNIAFALYCMSRTLQRYVFHSYDKLWEIKKLLTKTLLDYSFGAEL